MVVDTSSAKAAKGLLKGYTTQSLFYFKVLFQREHFEDLGKEGRIILKWQSHNRIGWCETDKSGSGQGPLINIYEHKNARMGSTKLEEFLY